MNVGRAPGIVMIAPRVGARLYAREAVAALVIGQRPSSTHKIWVNGSRMIIDNMSIAASGVCLPDFDECIAQRPSAFIEHAARDDDSFPLGLFRPVFR